MSADKEAKLKRCGGRVAEDEKFTDKEVLHRKMTELLLQLYHF